MGTRRDTVRTLGLGAGSFLFGGTAFGAASTIRFGYQRSSTLFTILMTNGVLQHRLASKGFGVSWNQFTQVLDPMTSGVIDFDPDVADAVPIFTQAAGAPLTFYAREQGSPAAEALIVHADTPFHRIEDLKGLAVGVSRGSGAHFLLLAALRRAGLGASDIAIKYLDAPDGVAAFGRRSIDAWAIWDPFLAIMEHKLPVRTIIDGTGLTSYHRYYLVNTSFVEKHPEIVAMVFDALAEAGQWVKANPQEATRTLGPLWGNVPTSVIESVNHRRTYLIQPVERAALREQQVIADTFFEAGLIPRKIDTGTVSIWRPDGRPG